MYTRTGHFYRAADLTVAVSAFPGMVYRKACGKSSSDSRDLRHKFKVMCQAGAEGRYLRISREGALLVLEEVEIQVTTKGENEKQ